jgi:hypothetical protein
VRLSENDAPDLPDGQVGGALGSPPIAAVYIGGSRPGGSLPGLAPAFYVTAAIAALAVLTTMAVRRRTAVVTSAAA